MNRGEIINIPLEYVDEHPFIQIKSECIRNISLSQLSEMDTRFKDYGITLFLNQIQALQPYKILFPCRERLAVGEHVVFAYVILDNGIGLSTLINMIVNNDQIKFRVNIIYITNRARMLESSDLLCTIRKDGEVNAIVRYEFSIIDNITDNITDNTTSGWIFRTLEVADNMDFPCNSMYQKNNVVVLDEEIISADSNELIYLDSASNIGVPELFTKVYKAFDTKDEDLFQECCHHYQQIINHKAKLEHENAKMSTELIELRHRANTQQTFLEGLIEKLTLQLHSSKTKI